MARPLDALVHVGSEMGRRQAVNCLINNLHFVP